MARLLLLLMLVLLLPMANRYQEQVLIATECLCPCRDRFVVLRETQSVLQQTGNIGWPGQGGVSVGSVTTDIVVPRDGCKGTHLKGQTAREASDSESVESLELPD